VGRRSILSGGIPKFASCVEGVVPNIPEIKTVRLFVVGVRFEM
jgi:hypothetical protein